MEVVTQYAEREMLYGVDVDPHTSEPRVILRFGEASPPYALGLEQAAQVRDTLSQLLDAVAMSGLRSLLSPPDLPSFQSEEERML